MLKDHKNVEQSINQLIDICKHQRKNGGGSDMNKGNQQQTPHDVKYLYGIMWEQKKLRNIWQRSNESKRKKMGYSERNQKKNGGPIPSEQNVQSE